MTGKVHQGIRKIRRFLKLGKLRILESYEGYRQDLTPIQYLTMIEQKSIN